MSDVYIERRTDIDGKKEYWLWHRLLYNGARPTLPLWQVDVVREDHMLADGFAWTGVFLASVTSLEDVASNWTVVDKAAWTYYEADGTSLGTGDPTSSAEWIESDVLGDDLQTAGVLSSKSYRTITAGGKAEYEFTITANEVGAFVDLQMLMWGVNFGDTHIGIMKDGVAFALNGRGVDPGEIYLDAPFISWTKHQPWDANGDTVDEHQPTSSNYPMEILRNLEAGTYKITLTQNLPSGTGRRCGPGRLRIRKNQTEIMPDDANRQLWFAEYTINAAYIFAGPFLHSNTTSDVVAMLKQGLGFVGGPAHGEEVQSAAVWTRNGVGPFDAAGMAEGAITAGDAYTLTTTTILYEDNGRTEGDKLAEVIVVYTFDATGLTVDVQIEWLQNTTITTCYVSMFAPGESARVPDVFEPDEIQFGDAAPVARGGTESEFDVVRRTYLYGDMEGTERNVGRKLVCSTNDLSAYGDFSSTTAKVFIIAEGKTYVKIADSTAVTVGLKWSGLITRYRFVESSYPWRAGQVVGGALHGTLQ